MRRSLAIMAALLLVAALAPSALAANEPAAKRAAPGPPPLVGLVTEGPTNDHSYNQAALEGVQAGAAAIGADVEVIVPASPADYATSIDTLAGRADVVVTVGFTMAEATLASATAYPAVQFFGIDEGWDSTPANLQGLLFDEAQAGFLAGIVAAWMTESDVIGAVGGVDGIPPVLRYMNGYQNGAAWLDANVAYIRNYAGSFADPEAGADAASALIDDGADVVFGVAGMTNEGIIAAACEAGVWAIGVDVDQYVQLPESQACLLTSAEKKVAYVTSLAIQRWFEGRPGFQTGVYVNGAWNDGIGLSPIRNVTVPKKLQQALDKAYRGLAKGKISPCLPTACETQ
jgi:basic membrane protein A